jgi:hypothetical protein
VTRAIGTQAELDVDTFGPFDAREPHIVLLCTDGLYRGISDEELRKTVTEEPAADQAARTLAAAAYRAGSDDNISVVLLRFGPDVPTQTSPEPPPLAAAAPQRGGSRLKEVFAALAPGRGDYTRTGRGHRRHSGRWTLLEILLIFLGIIVLTIAVLRMLPF